MPHTVRDLCRVAFEAVGLDYREHVRSDPALQRPGQPTRLLADPTRARDVLGWRARIEELVRTMVEGAPA